MIRPYDRKIILEDGTTYPGYGFGAPGDRVAEIVFNTSMAGYQEILSDPSYTGQAVVMTYPLMGNYGMCPEDYETERPTVSAMIVHEYNDTPSNFRSTHSLGEVMERFGIAGVSGVDTRSLAMHIRDKGTCKVLITGADVSPNQGMDKLRALTLPRDQVSRVSTPSVRFSPAPSPRFHVAAVDCGMKENIVRSLNARGCSVTILPWNTTAEAVEALNPDGVFLSNGPGDPAYLQDTVKEIRKCIGMIPVRGICLGHQLITIALGGRTVKMEFGHHGGNQPVLDVFTGKTFVTSQNHGFMSDEASLPEGVEVWLRNANDQSVEGLVQRKLNVMSVQFHPEASPGPHDRKDIFDIFIKEL